MAVVRSCLSGARFAMKADVVTRSYSTGDQVVGGEYRNIQDPDTFEVTRQWVIPTDTEQYKEIIKTIPCVVSSYAGTAGRNLNNTTVMRDENFRIDEYLSISWPAHYKLSANDRITNIRSQDNVLIWDEGDHGSNIKVVPTVFQLTGITPIVGFGAKVVEYYSVLKRASVQ